MKNILKKLLILQTELKCRKDKKAEKYKYRSAEDILENLKPLMVETNTTLLMSDDIEGEYFKTTITLYDIESEESIENHSYTKIWSNKWISKEWREYEKMSEGQMSWSTISYCRKYALCGMFAIDDGEDLDKVEDEKKEQEVKLTKEQIQNWEKVVKAFIWKYAFNADYDKEKALEEWRELLKVPMEEKDKMALIVLCKKIKWQ